MTNDNEKIVVFGPKDGESLKKSYPELLGYSEFKELSSDDLLFAWYVGNPTSPLAESKSATIKYSTAASICFKDNAFKKKTYADMNIPESVKVAIDRMKRISPEVRILSKRMVHKMFENFQKMVDVNVSDFVITDKEGNTTPDMTAKKQYIDYCTKISEALPGLIKQIEEGFGVENAKEDKKSGKKAIDKFHSDNS